MSTRFDSTKLVVLAEMNSEPLPLNLKLPYALLALHSTPVHAIESTTIHPYPEFSSASPHAIDAALDLHPLRPLL